MSRIYNIAISIALIVYCLSFNTWAAKKMEKGDNSVEEEYEFSKTLEGFGYDFNDDGELRSLENGGRYNFQVSDIHHYNQKSYEALGEVVTEHIYNILETEIGLKRVLVPIDSEEEEATSFIFMTDDALTSSKLLLLIHGSGAVRAGQWTRKLIINNKIDIGSQLPYIRQSIKDGYGVIVLNPNLNKSNVGKTETKIRFNDSPESHGIYVMQEFVLKAAATCIAIVAHSYGGIVTMEMANTFPEFFDSKVFALAFTDSVHSLRHQNAPVETQNLFYERGCNFAACFMPLNEPLDGYDSNDTPAVSAGTTQHEWTSHTSFDILFDFLARRLTNWVATWGLKDVNTDHDVLFKPDVEASTAEAADRESAANKDRGIVEDTVTHEREKDEISSSDKDLVENVNIDDDKIHCDQDRDDKKSSDNIPDDKESDADAKKASSDGGSIDTSDNNVGGSTKDTALEELEVSNGEVSSQTSGLNAASQNSLDEKTEELRKLDLQSAGDDVSGSKTESTEEREKVVDKKAEL